ncbi:MAG: beta-ketoacyl-ACP synthase III [Rickettsiales bacterium]
MTSTHKTARLLVARSYLPERCVENDALPASLETSDEWIASRTGIRRRHIASDVETVAFMAAEAARRTCELANVSAEEVGLIVVATTTPDAVFPSVATDVQRRIGAHGAAAFDVQAVCAGFVYALSVARSLMAQRPDMRYALVIGAEKMSSIVDWTDRSTCVLFGDGAGAALLRAEDGPAEGRGVIDFTLRADGRHRDILYADGGTSQKTIGLLRMQGREVFRHAGKLMAGAVQELLDRQSMAASEIDMLVPHQANKRIIDMTAELLGVPAEKTLCTVDRHANTSAASVPLALADADAAGKLRPGALLALTALGGGLSWGAALVRWG